MKYKKQINEYLNKIKNDSDNIFNLKKCPFDYNSILGFSEKISKFKDTESIKNQINSILKNKFPSIILDVKQAFSLFYNDNEVLEYKIKKDLLNGLNIKTKNIEDFAEALIINICPLLFCDRFNWFFSDLKNRKLEYLLDSSDHRGWLVFENDLFYINFNKNYPICNGTVDNNDVTIFWKSEKVDLKLIDFISPRNTSNDEWNKNQYEFYNFKNCEYKEQLKFITYFLKDLIKLIGIVNDLPNIIYNQAKETLERECIVKVEDNNFNLKNLYV